MMRVLVHSDRSLLMPSSSLEELLITRLVVARLGESDVMGWWRSDGLLGEDGAYVGPRVLPKTHATGRARIVFAVAGHACDERHPDPTVHHLFRLGPETEDRLDALLAEKLADFDFWRSQMDRLEAVSRPNDIGEYLLEMGVVTEEHLDTGKNRAMGPDNRSVEVPKSRDLSNTIQHLAAALVLSKPGELAVPCFK